MVFANPVTYVNRLLGVPIGVHDKRYDTLYSDYSQVCRTGFTHEYLSLIRDFSKVLSA